ncbi:MAG: GNAT family N-acyltransferase [Pseudomonadota bacterium]|nr:GNAT family N-acyltransferase [Pseudomonadota bacterium]
MSNSMRSAEPTNPQHYATARSTKPQRPVLTARLATGVVDVQAAQRLRAQVFGAEFGLSFSNGLDEERLDAYCAHLLVYDADRLIATTRLLDQHRARLAGGFYSEQEFHLGALLAQQTGHVLELGRTCVHPDYRSAAAINTLWQGIGMVVADWKIDTLMGCASIALGAGDCQGWLDRLPETQRLSVAVPPRRYLPPTALSHDPVLPPLLKAYLRMNARVGTSACFDPVFHCADVLVWMPIAEMDQRYFGRFGQNSRNF